MLPFDILDDLVDDLLSDDFWKFLMINEDVLELSYDKRRIAKFYYQFSTNVLKIACYVGDSVMVDWFIKRGEEVGSDAIESACFGGNLDVMKLILPLKHADRVTHIFESGCKYGKLEIVKWINESVHLDKSWGLYFACQYGHLDVTKWICENKFKSIPPRITNICEKGHLDVLKWLYENRNMVLSICSAYNHMYSGFNFCDEHAILYACPKERSDIKQWLYDTFGFRDTCRWGIKND